MGLQALNLIFLKLMLNLEYFSETRYNLVKYKY